LAGELAALEESEEEPVEEPVEDSDEPDDGPSDDAAEESDGVEGVVEADFDEPERLSVL
jgi:hypothetical protein